MFDIHLSIRKIYLFWEDTLNLKMVKKGALCFELKEKKDKRNSALQITVSVQTTHICRITL